MRAFHNDPAIKAKYIERVKAHAAADEIIKGKYWQNGKGCAVGCTIHSSNHLYYEIELCIPVQLAYLQDRIFENLPNELAKTWPLRFLEAIDVGADLEFVWPKFVHWLLVDPDHGMIRFNKSNTIKNIAYLFAQWIESKNKPSSNEFKSAAAAAAVAYDDAAATYAAISAAASAAAFYAAAASAVDYAAAASAAYAVDADVYADAKQNFYIIISEKLLHLSKDAKP